MHTTIWWSWEAANNTHNVPSGSDPSDPFACTSSFPTSYETTQCAVAFDENWGRVVLGGKTTSVLRASSAGSQEVDSSTTYAYKLSYPLVAQECGDCVAGMYWGNQNDGDYLDYYNGKFMGFAQTTVTNPDGSVDVHKYYATMGYGVYDTGQVTTCSSLPPAVCHSDPWWDPRNVGHGHELEVDHYDTDGTTLSARRRPNTTLCVRPVAWRELLHILGRGATGTAISSARSTTTIQ